MVKYLSIFSFLIFSVTASPSAWAQTGDNSPSKKKSEVAAETEPSDSKAPVKKEKNRWLSDNTMNIRFSPFGLLIRYYNVDVDFKVSEDWTFGPTVSYWKFDFPSVSGLSDVKSTVFAVGVRGNWYRNGAYEDGLYVSPMLRYLSVKITARGSSSNEASASANFISGAGVVGYHWFWDNFNLSLGGGLEAAVGASKVKVTDGSTSTEVDAARSGMAGLALDFMLGFAF